MGSARGEIVLTRENGGVEAFGYIQLYYKLKLQVNSQGMRWRVPPGKTIRQIMGSTTRNNARLLEEYREWLVKEGYVKAPVET